MLVQEIMTLDVITAKKTDKLKDAAATLFKQNLTGMPVVDEENKVIGIITEYDFINPDLGLHIPTYIDFLQSIDMVKDKNTSDYKADVADLTDSTVEQIMTSDVKTVNPTTDLKDVVKLVVENRINPVPVVDNNNKLKGIISRSDLLKII